MAKIASLWIGNELGIIEKICIESFLRNGDDFTLFTYGKVKNIPSKVNVVNANEILNGEKILRHAATGSPAPHSDLFRYALLLKTDFIWVDLDILPLKPFDFKDEWIFGYESTSIINGAVLRIPKNSKTLQSLSAFNVNTKGIPPHIDLISISMIKFIIKSIISRSTSIEHWPWGSTCPLGLTYFLNKYNEAHYALDIEAFYPVPFENVENLLKPNFIQDNSFSEKTWAVHLWGKELRYLLSNKYNGQIPKNSFLYKFI